MPTQERSFRSEAVVLKHSDWGEADRMLTLYTRDHGKARAIAKGARKMRSRKAGHVEPLTRVQLQLAKGRDMLIVTQAETVSAYLNLKADLLRLSYASYVVELLDRFTYDTEENQGLYRLLIDTLARLDQDGEPLLTLRYYEIHLLDLLGYRPHLFHCAICGADIQPEDQFFSASEGGVLCPRCGKTSTERRHISIEALRFLRHFQRSPFTEALRARPAPEIFREMEAIMQYYLTYILERGLNTPAFIRRIKETPPSPYQPNEE